METRKATFREIAIAALEKINELCLDQRWLESRRQILELSHEVVQELNSMEDNSVIFSDSEILDLQIAVLNLRFSLFSNNNENWKHLNEKLDEIINKRKEFE